MRRRAGLSREREPRRGEEPGHVRRNRRDRVDALMGHRVVEREAAGVEHRGLHALRHSFASNLYARGVEVKVISKLLGHASVEITYNRYIHFFEGEIDDTLRQAVGV